MKQHIPNTLTILRIVLIPLLIMVYWNAPETIWPFAVFFMLGATDLLDGYLARRWRVTSEFGAFLDPVADKLMVVTLLIVMAVDTASLWFTLPAMVIILRELLMSMLREFLATRGASDVVSVDTVGKYKTAAQMVGLGLCLMPSTSAQMMGYVALYVATFLTCYSLYRYILKSVKWHLSRASKNTHTLIHHT